MPRTGARLRKVKIKMKILLSHEQKKLKEKFIKIHKEIAKDCLFGNLDFNSFEYIENMLLGIELMILSLSDVSSILDIKEDYYKKLISKLQDGSKQ